MHSAHVCPYRCLIYLPITVWRRLTWWGWREETRAALLTRARAVELIETLTRLVGELEAIEAGEQRTREAVGVVERAA